MDKIRVYNPTKFDLHIEKQKINQPHEYYKKSFRGAKIDHTKFSPRECVALGLFWCKSYN